MNIYLKKKNSMNNSPDNESATVQEKETFIKYLNQNQACIISKVAASSVIKGEALVGLNEDTVITIKETKTVGTNTYVKFYLNEVKGVVVNLSYSEDEISEYLWLPAEGIPTKISSYIQIGQVNEPVNEQKVTEILNYIKNNPLPGKMTAFINYVKNT